MLLPSEDSHPSGQPWLVNALAYEVTFEIKENRDRSRVITSKMMQEAKDNLNNKIEQWLEIEVMQEELAKKLS